MSNTLLVIAKSYELIPESKRHPIANEFGNVISMPPFVDTIDQFPIEELFVILEDCNAVFQKEVLEKLSPLLEKNKALDAERMDVLVRHYAMIDPETAAKIRIVINGLYPGSEAPVLHCLDKVSSSKEAAEVFVDSVILTSVAKSITNDPSEINFLRINVFQRLRWLADEEGKTLFVNKMLDLICEPLVNTVQPKAKIGLENLLTIGPAEIPTSSLTAVADRLSKACLTLIDPQEKLNTMRVLFTFARNMQEERLEFIAATLVDPTLRFAGPDLVIQVLNLLDEYHFPTLTMASTLKTVLDRIQSDLQDVRVIRYVVENTSGEQRAQATQTLADLIKTKPPPLDTVFSAIQENKSQFDAASIDNFCDTALARSKTGDRSIAVSLLEFAVQILDAASQSQKNAFVNHMVECMKETDPNRRQIGAEYYRKGRGFVEETTRRASARSLILKLESDGSNFNEQTKVILDVIFDELELLESDEARLQDLLRAAATDAKGEECRIIALDYVGKLAVKKGLPQELEESLYDATRSKTEKVSAKALEVLKTLKIKKLPSDIKKKLEEAKQRELGKAP